MVSKYILAMCDMNNIMTKWNTTKNLIMVTKRGGLCFGLDIIKAGIKLALLGGSAYTYYGDYILPPLKTIVKTVTASSLSHSRTLHKLLIK